MSDVIDWSKAPEGYPIWIQGKDSYYSSGWHRELSDRYQSPTGRYYMKRDCAVFTVHTRPQPTPWSGEGLPPVGTVCEVVNCNHDFTKQFNGARVEIILNDGDLAVFRVLGFLDDLKPRYHALIASKFRPIRTPEQIAADELDNRAHDLFRIAWPETHSWGDLSPHWQEAFCRLADSGYRKP